MAEIKGLPGGQEIDCRAESLPGGLEFECRDETLPGGQELDCRDEKFTWRPRYRYRVSLQR